MMKKNNVFWGLAAMSLLTAMSLMSTGCNNADGDDSYMDLRSQLNAAENMTPDMPVGDQFTNFDDNPFVRTADQPVSTFSVDADGASYAIVRRYLTNEMTVNPSSVRIEELLNYFTFNYPLPTDGENVAINAEVGDCPWNAEHKLLRLGIKGKELSAAETPRANFVFLVDVSGSMSSEDKLYMLKAGLNKLLAQMNPDDRISIVTYSGEVKKVLESTPVSESEKIYSAINLLNAFGATSGGEALKMAYEEALANYNPQCNNRIIMGTDGDFNVGVTNTDSLVSMVERYARQGIYMTCLGFGLGNLNDAMMEKISNAGNGTYHYIDNENEMTKVFVHERNKFVSVANDAKCQVTFNSDIVTAYRLIGYENRILNRQDFEDDEKDAGEIGAGQTITALYELVVEDKPEGIGIDEPFATFDFRYKKTLKSESTPLQLKMPTEKLFEKQARSSEFDFAAGVAAYGMILRQSPHKGHATIDMAKELVERGLNFDPHGYRSELLRLMDAVPENEE